MNKICTSIEQSQKLLELGVDVKTADMMWDDWRLIDEGWKLNVGYYPEIEQDYGRKCYPAWSLSALLGIIPAVSLNAFKDGNWNAMVQHDGKMIYVDKDNPIDACYEVIIKLYEQKLL